MCRNPSTHKLENVTTWLISNILCKFIRMYIFMLSVILWRLQLVSKSWNHVSLYIPEILYCTWYKSLTSKNSYSWLFHPCGTPEHGCSTHLRRLRSFVTTPTFTALVLWNIRRRWLRNRWYAAGGPPTTSKLRLPLWLLQDGFEHFPTNQRWGLWSFTL